MGSKPKNLTEAIDQLGSYAGQASQGVEEAVEKLKPHLEELQRLAREEGGKAKAKVEAQVNQNPWAALGIVGLIFFILGFLFASSGRRND